MQYLISAIVLSSVALISAPIPRVSGYNLEPMEFSVKLRESDFKHGSRHIRNLKHIEANCNQGEFIQGLSLENNGAVLPMLRKYKWRVICAKPKGTVPEYTCDAVPIRSDVINTARAFMGIAGSRGIDGLGAGCSAENEALSSWNLDSFQRCQGFMCMGRSGRVAETWSKCCHMPKTVWTCKTHQSATSALPFMNPMGKNTLPFQPIACKGNEIMKSWQYHRSSEKTVHQTYQCCSIQKKAGARY